jgi:enediyne biosynthesis protein E4
MRANIITRRSFLKTMTALGFGNAARRRIHAVSTASASKSRISFENVARASGIQFVLDNSATPEKYQAETMAGGVAMLDYNNDGLLDLYFTNGAHLPEMDKTNARYRNRLFRNNGDGTFTDVTNQAGVEGSRYSIGVAAADYDNDGNQDLFITGANGYQLFHNNGNGTFSDVTESAGLTRVHPALRNAFSASAGWFDYDNDGHLDLFVVNYLKWSSALDPVCLERGIRAYCSPNSYEGLPNLLFHNNGDGTFTDVSESSGIFSHIGKGMGVAFADYDNDGFVDVFVSNDSFRNFLFRNHGDGKFTEVGLLAGIAYNQDGKSVAGMGADFRDIDNDGFADIFETDMYGDNFLLFHNAGKGRFDDRTFSSRVAAATSRMTGWSAGIFDFDNDGWKDIFTSNAAIQDNSELVDNIPYKLVNGLLKNNRDGTFSDVSTLAGPSFNVPAAHRGAAFGDLNNDGRIDVVTNCLNAEPEILMNRSTNSGHWLLIDLIGTVSNRDGLGSRLRLTTANGTQFNHATTSVGYGSSSDKRVHFGLGSSSQAERLDVWWPSGVRQTVTNIRADQVITVREPPSR